jgi:arsenate reductase (thioredoxin)
VTIVDKQRVLFVSTDNAARSQMAEGMLRAWAGDRYDVASAGIEPTQLRPEAVSVMAESGIDISGHHTEPINTFLGQPWDWVITVCETARHTCPVFPGASRTDHWSFDDPAAGDATDDERLARYRRVRTEIGDRIRLFVLVADRPYTQATHEVVDLPKG